MNNPHPFAPRPAAVMRIDTGYGIGRCESRTGQRDTGTTGALPHRGSRTQWRRVAQAQRGPHSFSSALPPELPLLLPPLLLPLLALLQVLLPPTADDSDGNGAFEFVVPLRWPHRNRFVKVPAFFASSQQRVHSVQALLPLLSPAAASADGGDGDSAMLRQSTPTPTPMTGKVAYGNRRSRSSLY